MYKINSNDTIKKENSYIPIDSANRHYQQFIQDVAEQGYDIVEGPDVVQPSYAELRSQEYPSREEQLDMIYWDKVNGTTTWEDTIQAIKDKYPKTITGGTTIGEVPAWVQEAADNWTFNKQLREYVTAVERLAQYVLSEGRPEITEEIVIRQEPVLDDEGMQTFDEDGNMIMVDITETVITQTAIEPLEATVEVTETDEETMESTTTTVTNPLIVRDEEERSASQAVINATPQTVIDAVNAEK